VDKLGENKEIRLASQETSRERDKVPIEPGMRQLAGSLMGYLIYSRTLLVRDTYVGYIKFPSFKLQEGREQTTPAQAGMMYDSPVQTCGIEARGPCNWHGPYLKI